MISLVLLATLSASPSATQADELLTRAKAELKAGRVKEACGLFAESHRLEPALGALLNLASCYETQGRLATAFLRFNEAEAWAARVSDRPRREFAAERSAALKPKLAWLALTATTPLVGEVARVGTEPDAPLGGSPLVVPVDAGRVHIEVRAPNMQPWITDLDAPSPGSTKQVFVPALIANRMQPAPTPVAEAAPVTLTPSTPVENANPTPALTEAQPQVTRAPVKAQGAPAGAIALTAVSAAVAAAGAAGVVWSFVSVGELETEKNAQTPTLTNTQIEERLGTLRVVYPASWVTFGVGAAGTLIGSILCATAKSDTAVAVMPIQGGAALSVSGQF